HFFFQAEDGIRYRSVTGVQTCALPIYFVLLQKFLRFFQCCPDVMTSKNLVTAPVGTTLEEAEKLLQKYKIEKLPLVDDANILKRSEERRVGKDWTIRDTSEEVERMERK